MAVFFFSLPILIPLLITTEKWRRIIFHRLGWRTYPWEDQGEREMNLRTVWIHALSVGEVIAARPLVRRIQENGCFDRIVVSCSTYSGFQTAKGIFNGFATCYFPYDWIFAIRRMVRKIEPKAVVIIETDLWPNFLFEMQRLNIPIFLANMRLSDKSMINYRRFTPVVKMLFGPLTKIGVQSHRDFERFLRLGIPAERLCITGNIKFEACDVSAELAELPKLRRRLHIGQNSRVIVAGSTHPGEEIFLLKAFQVAGGGDHDDRLIIAPRDPARAAEIVLLSNHHGLKAQRFSTLDAEESPHCKFPIVVIDCLGVLKTLYGLADIAFIGGSMVPCGGHNPLEPAAWGKPLLFGTDMRDFFQIADWLLSEGGAIKVHDTGQLSSQWGRLLADGEARRRMGEKAIKVFQAHRGAVEKTVACFGFSPENNEAEGSPCR